MFVRVISSKQEILAALSAQAVRHLPQEMLSNLKLVQIFLLIPVVLQAAFANSQPDHDSNTSMWGPVLGVLSMLGY